ncbi:exopolysaccharide biosynthesis polyprenyl glycosylphosphotransferase [Novipirellula sp.]|uniref:exopolysaccharide biosynthesis polyprenyl glycosylphosphotransferase n=1 Tax=Novipirellula sp. TaxID=2795430 RepID=UPI0035635E42
MSTRFETTARLLGPMAVAAIVSSEEADDANLASVEEILSEHTACRPSRRLSVAYSTQAFLTGLPLLIVDLLVTGFCLVGAAYIVDLFLQRPLHPGTWNQLPAILLLQFLFMSIHQMYPGVGDSQIAELRGLVRSTIFSFVSLAALNAMLGQLPRVEFIMFLIGVMMTAFFLPLSRNVARRYLARRTWWGMRALIVGDAESSQQTFRRLKSHPTCGYRPVAIATDYIEPDVAAKADLRTVINSYDIVEIARNHHTPVVVLTSSDTRVRLTERLIFTFPSVVVFGNLQSAILSGERSPVPGSLITRINRPLPRFMPRVTKRLFDLAICVPLFLLLLIPGAIIAMAIKIASPGPIFYGDPRVGQHGIRFKMWKFRTMIPNASHVLDEHLRAHPELQAEWNETKKIKNDPRIVPYIGSAMRRWSLDELPQLWNVLVGEMSLVGPRPMPADEIVRYNTKFFEYTHMTPGLTGLWQVAGRNDVTFQTRVMLVEYYAKNWSLWLDIWILARTPSVVLKNEGAY